MVITPDFLLSNMDRIGAYALLLFGVWALVTGRLITVGRLDDWRDLVKLLREENGQLRETQKASNAALERMADQMQETNRTLAALVEPGPVRRGGRAT